MRGPELIEVLSGLLEQIQYNVTKYVGNRASLISRRVLNLILVLVIIVSAGVLRSTLTLNKDDLSKSADTEAEDPHQVASDRASQFEIKYASHLLTQESGRARLSTAGTDNYTTTLVIGRLSADEERTRWVLEKLHNIDSLQLYVVDDPKAAGPHLEKNHGREAAVYLKYIVEHYDELHDITFFWHADEQVWHNNMLLGWDSVQTINRMDRHHIIETGYVPSRCDHWPGCPQWIRFDPSKAEHHLDPHRLEEMFTPDLFSQLFPNSTDFPPYFSGTCCSQFALSRDQIRTRPKETYEAILDWVLEYESDDRSGQMLEYTWPYIFTGKGSVCPPMDECYCKTYGFCMHNPDDIEELGHWNRLRTRREEVKWQLTFMEETLENVQRAEEEKGASGTQIVAIEERYLPEIERLTAQLERLVNSTWQSREKIVRKWHLPVPPTGW